MRRASLQNDQKVNRKTHYCILSHLKTTQYMTKAFQKHIVCGFVYRQCLYKAMALLELITRTRVSLNSELYLPLSLQGWD